MIETKWVDVRLGAVADVSSVQQVCPLRVTTGHSLQAQLTDEQIKAMGH
jgi:hypothetical protein